MVKLIARRNAAADVCLCEKEHLPAEKLSEATRMLRGLNMGKPLEAMKELEGGGKFDFQGYVFKAASEQSRPPRVVRIGLIQNSIVESTSAPFAVQRKVGWKFLFAVIRSKLALENLN